MWIQNFQQCSRNLQVKEAITLHNQCKRKRSLDSSYFGRTISILFHLNDTSINWLKTTIQTCFQVFDTQRITLEHNIMRNELH